MLVLSMALVALGIAYASVLVRFTYGFRTLTARWEPQRPEPGPAVSVVVPARDEAGHIADCIESILRNDYPETLTAVTVVDDGSTDGTAEIVSRLTERDGRLGLIRLAQVRPGATGKRAAIRLAVDRSEADVILVTDADSRVPPTWIRTMISAFGDAVEFVSGPVAYESRSGLLGGLLQLELLGLVAVGAGGIARGRPNTCNGANIAFKRAAFHRIGGYAGTEGLTSGDDELLMQKMARARRDSVAFCPDPAAVVVTKPPAGILELFRQRRRWASKGLHYPEVRITLLALLVFAFNFFLLAGLILAFIYRGIWPFLLTAFLVKLVAEGWMFWNVCAHFGRKELLPMALPGQLFEIPYVVITAFAGVAGGYSWKGRDIRR